MAKIYLIGENLLTIDSLKNTLIAKGYDVHSEYTHEQLKIDKILEAGPDILFWNSDIVESREKKIFEFLEQANLSCKSIFMISNSITSVLGYGLIQGIHGFVHERSDIEELEDCISSLKRGDTYISPHLAGGFKSVRNLSLVKEKSKESVLTKQEHKILRMVNNEKTSKEIANILNISYRTVQNHRQNICRKLGLKGRNKLAEFANLYFG